MYALAESKQFCHPALPTVGDACARRRRRRRRKVYSKLTQ